MSDKIIYITKDGLNCIEDCQNQITPRIKRFAKESLKAFDEGAILESEISTNNIREYEYKGRAAGFFIYEEI